MNDRTDLIIILIYFTLLVIFGILNAYIEYMVDKVKALQEEKQTPQLLKATKRYCAIVSVITAIWVVGGFALLVLNDIGNAGTG